MVMFKERFLRRTEASEHLKENWGIERRPSTLAKLKCWGEGPPVIMAGRVPLYPLSKLDQWASDLIIPYIPKAK